MHRGAGPLPEAILAAVRRAGVVIFVIPARTIPLRAKSRQPSRPGAFHFILGAGEKATVQASPASIRFIPSGNDEVSLEDSRKALKVTDLASIYGR